MKASTPSLMTRANCAARPMCLHMSAATPSCWQSYAPTARNCHSTSIPSLTWWARRMTAIDSSQTANRHKCSRMFSASDQKSVVKGKSVAFSVHLGGPRTLKKQNTSDKDMFKQLDIKEE